MPVQDLYHFYHIYADGHWKPILKEHLESLSKNFLLKNLKGFYIGIIGSKQNRDNVKIYLNRLGYKYHVCGEANIGWEQLTLDALHSFAQKNDGFVLYAHTKGASRPDREIVSNWRYTLTYSTIDSWYDCVDELESGAAAAGGHYLTVNPTQQFELASAIEEGFFAGNYWWTTLSNIRQLPICSKENRWEAESWITKLKQIYESQNKKYYIYNSHNAFPH